MCTYQRVDVRILVGFFFYFEVYGVADLSRLTVRSYGVVSNTASTVQIIGFLRPLQTEKTFFSIFGPSATLDSTSSVHKTVFKSENTIYAIIVRAIRVRLFARILSTGCKRVFLKSFRSARFVLFRDHRILRVLRGIRNKIYAITLLWRSSIKQKNVVSKRRYKIYNITDLFVERSDKKK